jgi:hypothetical protein
MKTIEIHDEYIKYIEFNPIYYYILIVAILYRELIIDECYK